MKVITKKYLIAVAIFSVSFVNSFLFAPEVEVKVELKKPEEYKAPETKEEAQKKLEEAERQYEEAEKAVKEKDEAFKIAEAKVRETPKENVEDYRKVTEDVQKAQDDRKAAEVVRKEWSERKIQLSEDLKSLTKALAASVEQPSTIPIVEQPTWWQKVRDAVGTWFDKVKGRISDFLGISKKMPTGPEIPVTAARPENVTTINAFTQGAQSVADSVKETTPELNAQAKKIEENVQIVEENRGPLIQGTLPEEKKEKVIEAVKEVVVAVETVEQQVKKQEGVDQTTKDSIKELATSVTEAVGLPKQEVDELKDTVEEAVLAAPPPPPVEKPKIISKKDITQNKSFKDLQNAVKTWGENISGATDVQLNKISLTYSLLENAVNRGEFAISTMPEEITNFIAEVKKESGKRLEETKPSPEFTQMTKGQKKQKLSDFEDVLKEAQIKYNKAIKTGSVSQYSDAELKSFQRQLNDYYTLEGEDAGLLRFRAAVTTELNARKKEEATQFPIKPMPPVVKPPEVKTKTVIKEDIKQSHDYKALVNLEKIYLLKDSQLNQILNNYNELEKSIRAGEFTVDEIPADIARIKEAIEDEFAQRKQIVIPSEKKPTEKPTYDIATMSMQEKVTARDTLEKALKEKVRVNISTYTLEELKALDLQINDYLKLVDSISENDDLYKKEASDIMQFRVAVGTNIRVREQAAAIPGS